MAKKVEEKKVEKKVESVKKFDQPLKNKYSFPAQGYDAPEKKKFQ